MVVHLIDYYFYIMHGRGNARIHGLVKYENESSFFTNGNAHEAAIPYIS
jgi:hypothetical protein